MRAARRLVVFWIATLALLMAALAPAISHAGAARTASWAELCTGAGSRLVALPAGDAGTGSAPAALHLLDHCPYCSLHADALPLPPAPVLPPAALLGDHLPPAFLHAPRSFAAWAGARARAPPARG